MLVFCLPHAGATGASFYPLARHLPPHVTLRALDCPGRAGRFREPALETMDEVVDDLLPTLAAAVGAGTPYALFGYSYGAIVAYALTRRLAQWGGAALPRRIFACASAGPGAPSGLRGAHRLDEAALLALLRDLGGCPEEFFAHPELIELFLPVLRSDLRAAESFADRWTAPLPVPVSVMLGAEDEISGGDASPWLRVGGEGSTVQHFSGGHFFLFEQLGPVGAAMGALLGEEPARA